MDRLKSKAQRIKGVLEQTLATPDKIIMIKGAFGI